MFSVAHPLRLDYTGLKEWLDGVPDRKEKAAKPALIERIYLWVFMVVDMGSEMSWSYECV